MSTTSTKPQTIARISVRVSNDRRAIAVIASDGIELDALDAAVRASAATMQGATVKKVQFTSQADDVELVFGPAWVVRVVQDDNVLHRREELVEAVGAVVAAMFDP
jgi:hypothetical protein